MAEWPAGKNGLLARYEYLCLLPAGRGCLHALLPGGSCSTASKGISLWRK